MPAIRDPKINKKEIKNILKHFKNITRSPEDFLSVQPVKTEQSKNLLKDIYGISMKNVQNEEYDDIVLPELVLDDMDEEQIWQQIELRNNSIWPKFLEKTSRFLVIKNEGYILNCIDAENNSDNHKIKDENEETADSELETTDNEFKKNEDSENEDSEEMLFKKQKKTKKNKKVSVVDDKFFKLSEMEEFLVQEDRKEELRLKGKITDNEDAIDYFDNLSDEEDENAKYLEFFDNDDEEEELSPESLEKNRRKNLKKRRNNQESDESELENYSQEDDSDDGYDDELYYQKLRKNSENSLSGMSKEDYNEYEGSEEDEKPDDNSDLDSTDDDKVANLLNKEDSGSESDTDESIKNNQEKSSFEQRQDRLKQRIEEIEENIINEKPWQLKGEITATGRPQNSLLEEILEFDAATRPAPIITEETTLRLEDIIKQRIKDKAWDDVERKYKPIQTPQEYRKKLVLDQEKSKESLAQIYEKEYRSELEKLNPDNSNTTEEEPKQHKEIRELMKILFTKLDALSNFHYTPKPTVPEPKIITNTPAINMEEVAPVAMTDANQLAPEEIKSRPKGDIIGKSERQKSDKNRERRKKKIHQKLVHKRKEEKEIEKQKLGLKLNKKDEKEKNLKNVIKHRNVQKIDTNSISTSSYKSSKAFFSVLQDKTATSSKFKRGTDKLKKEEITAKKLKL